MKTSVPPQFVFLMLVLKKVIIWIPVLKILLLFWLICFDPHTIILGLSSRRHTAVSDRVKSQRFCYTFTCAKSLTLTQWASLFTVLIETDQTRKIIFLPCPYFKEQKAQLWKIISAIRLSQQNEFQHILTRTACNSELHCAFINSAAHAASLGQLS